jgi:hypothetical protein
VNFILEGILGVVEKFAEIVAAGAVTVLNLLFGAFEATVGAALALLPALPEIIAPPEFVGTINWFFPIGTIVSVATGLLVSYGIFLGIRWLLQKSGMIG